MRCRYCSTICRDVVRPSRMAFCMSGMVASTTLNCGWFRGGASLRGTLLQAARAAARPRTTAADDFMAGIIILLAEFFYRPQKIGRQGRFNRDALAGDRVRERQLPRMQHVALRAHRAWGLGLEACVRIYTFTDQWM